MICPTASLLVADDAGVGPVARQASGPRQGPGPPPSGAVEEDSELGLVRRHHAGT